MIRLDRFEHVIKNADELLELYEKIIAKILTEATFKKLNFITFLARYVCIQTVHIRFFLLDEDVVVWVLLICKNLFRLFIVIKTKCINLHKLSLSAQLQRVPPEPSGPPGTALGLGIPVTFTDSSRRTSCRCLSAQFTMFVNRVYDPVGFRIATNSLQ
jgi:hypothetical protein